MKRPILIKFLSFFLLFSLLFGFFLIGNVSGATADITLTDWYPSTVGSTKGTIDYVNYSKISASFVITDSWYKPDDTYHRSLVISCGKGWINLTTFYSYIGSIHLYLNIVEGGASVKYGYMTFYNGSNIAIKFRFTYSNVGAEVIAYQKPDLSWVQIVSGADSGNTDGWLNITHVNTNTMNYSYEGDLGIGSSVGATFSSSVWTTFTKISVDMLNVTDGNNYLYLDDIVINTESGVLPPGGCTDFSGYDNIDLTIGHTRFDTIVYSNKYLEFTGISQISARLRGFELLVSPVQISSDSDLNNYLLYLNNIYIGSADCYKNYMDGYLLQWDLTSLNLTLLNELPIFELVHDTTSSTPWYIGTNPCWPFQESHKRYEIYSTSHINGQVILSDASKLRYSSPNWILYYSDFDVNTTNPGYQNSITLYDSNHLELTEGIWNIPTGYVFKTIFIDVKVDTTDKYKLYIYNEDDDSVGSAQYFPKELLSYHSIYSWTPFYDGNYTISLMYGSIYTVNVSLNITFVNTSFALWTTPNPSKYGSSVLVGVYAEDIETYVYYSIGIFGDSINVNNLELADIRIDIPYFTNSFFYTETWLSGLHSPSYLRLFGSNGSAVFRPITGLYLHYTQYLVKQAFIKTSLQYDTGTVGQLFDVFGSYTYTFSNAEVFLGNEAIYDVATGSFSFNYQFSKVGTYTFYLKEYNVDSWFTLDSVTVSIIASSPTGDALTNFMDTLPLFVKIILAFIIILLCTISPLIATTSIKQGIKIQSFQNIDIPALVYVGFFMFGIVITCLIGLLPYVVIAIVLIGLILAFAILWMQRKVI